MASLTWTRNTEAIKRAEQTEARNRRAEHRTLRLEHESAPPRALKVDSAAIQRRNELAAELLDYYKFLATLYLPIDSIRVPPKGGWPSITAERLSNLGKTDTVIDVLKHIPYVSTELRNDYHVEEEAVCHDYSGPQSGRYNMDPFDDLLDGNDIWENRLADMQHIVTLAYALSRNGNYILYDFRDGQMSTIQFQDRAFDSHSPKGWCSNAKGAFRDLALFPTGAAPDRVEVICQGFISCSHEQLHQLRSIFKKHGWCTKDYRKEACLVEVNALWDFFYLQRKRAREDALQGT